MKFTAEQYAELLQDLGQDVEAEIEYGRGLAILIKPAKKKGKSLILTKTLSYLGTNDKDFLDEISTLIQGNDEEWDWYHPYND